MIQIRKFREHVDDQLLLENAQQAKAILKSLDIDPSNNDSFKEIRRILKGHEGYLGWFTKLLFIKKYKIDDLLHLYDFIKNNSAYISMLKDNVIKYDNIEKLQDDVESVKSESLLRRIYNEFPNKQKNFIDIKKDNKLLDSLSRRKDFKGFFKKVASYHTRKELIDGLKIFLSTDPSATLDKIMSIAKSNGSEIKYFSYDDNILIVRVFNSSELNSIAGDCSWCIKNSGTFQSYAGNGGKQYVIFLFDRTDNLSKIGLTLHISKANSNFYSTAHDKRDSHISYDRIKSILSEYGYDISKLSYKLSEINPNTTSAKTLKNVFNLSNEEIVKIKSTFKPDDLKLFSKEEIEKWNLLEKTPIDCETLIRYTFDEIKSKNLFKRVENLYLSYIIKLYGDYGYQVIDYLKDNKEILNNLSHSGYGGSDYDFYKDYILNIKKPLSLWNLEVGSRWGSREDNRYSYEKTIFRILWFIDDIKKLIENEKDGIKRVIDSFEKNTNLDSIRILVDELGVKIEDLLEIGKDSPKFLLVLIKYCKANNIKYDKIRDEYFNLVIGYKIDDHDLSEFKEVLTDEQYDTTLKVKERQEFRSELSRFKPYNSGCNKTESKKFYDKWKKYIDSQKDISSLYTRYYDEYMDLGLILIYTKLDKLDELPKLKISRDMVSTLNEILSGTFITNGGMREKLTEEECEKTYKWLISNDLSQLTLHRYSSENHENGVYEVHEGDGRYYYLSSMYLYDKPAFEKYMKYAATVKYNVRKDHGFSMTGILPRPGDRSMYSTIRPREIYPMAKFFEKKISIDKNKDWLPEYKKLISEVISWNLKIYEITDILSYSYFQNAEARKLFIDELVRKNASINTIRKCTRPSEFIELAKARSN